MLIFFTSYLSTRIYFSISKVLGKTQPCAKSSIYGWDLGITWTAHDMAPTRHQTPYIYKWFLHMAPTRHQTSYIYKWFLHMAPNRHQTCYIYKWFLHMAPNRHQTSYIYKWFLNTLNTQIFFVYQTLPSENVINLWVLYVCIYIYVLWY